MLLVRKQFRRLLGVVAWYRRFVPDLATLAEPITALTRKNRRIVWGQDQIQAFHRIKQIQLSSSVLVCPDFSRPFSLQCHASTVGLGAVLSQLKGESELVVAYASRLLTKSERKFSDTERECLAVVWAAQKYRPYLEGRKYVVFTDAHSLRWLLGQRSVAGRLARWIDSVTLGSAFRYLQPEKYL